MDAFPEHLSSTVVPVTLPEKPDALEYAAQQGQVRAGILYQEPHAKRVFTLFRQDPWYHQKTLMDNFKRAVLEAKHVNEFRPNAILWEKVSKSLLKNPDRLLKNTDKRMVYIYGNLFFVKKDFTFGLRTVHPGQVHFIQTTHVPLLLYELPPSSLQCRARPNVNEKSFEPYDQMLYHRTILEPHTAYPIPAGTHYLLLTVQKTVLGLDLIPESLLPQLLQKGFHLGDFRKKKTLDQTAYKLPPPTPVLGLKRSGEETRPSKKRGCIQRLVQIPQPELLYPPPVQIPQPELLYPQPVQIPEPEPIPEPVQIPQPEPIPEPELLSPPPVQIPELELISPPPVQIPEPQPIPEPELISPEPEAAWLDQLLTSFSGPSVLHLVPSFFDENNELITFLETFEHDMAMEPLDLSMPKLSPCIRPSVGFKAMQPLNLSCKV